MSWLLSILLKKLIAMAMYVASSGVHAALYRALPDGPFRTSILKVRGGPNGTRADKQLGVVLFVFCVGLLFGGMWFIIEVWKP